MPIIVVLLIIIIVILCPVLLLVPVGLAALVLYVGVNYWLLWVVPLLVFAGIMLYSSTREARPKENFLMYYEPLGSNWFRKR